MELSGSYTSPLIAVGSAVGVRGDLPGWLATAVAVRNSALSSAVWVTVAFAFAWAVAVALATAVWVTAAGSTKVNSVGALAEAPAEFVRVTVTLPALRAGVCT